MGILREIVNEKLHKEWEIGKWITKTNGQKDLNF